MTVRRHHFLRGLVIVLNCAGLMMFGVGCSTPMRPVDAVLWIGGFAHDWEPAAKTLTADLSRRMPIDVEIARDGSFLDSSDTDKPDVILMHHCYKSTEEVITSAQQQKLLDWVRGGVGVVAIHASYYSFLEWDAFHEMFGTRWIKHGDVGVMLTVRTVDKQHPITRDLAESFEVISELYQSMPLDDQCHPLAVAKENRGSPEYPSVWARPYGQGKVVTILPGHGPEAFATEGFQKLIAASTLWAADRPVKLRPVVEESGS